MKSLKQFIFQKFNALGILFLLASGSLFLIMLRLKLTESFYLLFLVWNLFLATIPFLISSFLSIKQRSRPTLLFLGTLWLLFLPNAPYIVTDLIHLRNSPMHLVWYDSLMIIAFAVTGLYLYFLSALDMIRIVKVQLGRKAMKWFAIFIPFLVGFGIYLGRFLRWNSWDILQNPTGLFYDIINIFTNPLANKLAWGITIGFGCGLWLWQILIGRIIDTNTESHS